MQTEKKAFKVVYNLVLDGVITEKEAYSLVEGIFQQKILQIPTPVPIMPDDTQQENPIEEPAKQVEVRGFVNNE